MEARTVLTFLTNLRILTLTNLQLKMACWFLRIFFLANTYLGGAGTAKPHRRFGPPARTLLLFDL